MELTTRDRIEQEIDKRGLLGKWNELNTNTDYIRGLILLEAKKDWKSVKNNGEWNEYLKDFLKDGKPLSVQYAASLMRATKEKEELSLHSAKASVQYLANGLNETEAELSLPESSATQISLRGENAIQKARNWQDIKEATGKEEPSDRDVRQYNKDLREAKEKLNQEEEERNEYAKSRQIPKKVKKPDPFTTEEEIDFETWCINVHGFDILAEKPKNTRAIYALKDENVTTLFNRIDEWKTAYKLMAKLCHPDTGGNSLAMSFLTDFKELMNSLKGIKDIVDYENKIEEYRIEYSSPRKLSQ